VNEDHDTQLWMSGMPVKFVKWTPNGLIYHRVGSQETMAHLSRGTIQRLLREDVLRIEGYHPEWASSEGLADLE
jgi:hypothetical protein